MWELYLADKNAVGLEKKTFIMIQSLQDQVIRLEKRIMVLEKEVRRLKKPSARKTTTRVKKENRC